LHENNKIRDANDVNKIICAEIPNEIEYPKLYALVKQYMVHGPCGTQNYNSPCMENNKCTKNFPKDYCDETYLNNNGGYPIYRRRNNDDKIIYNLTSKNSKLQIIHL